MPKMKSNSGAKKRFRATASGKIKRNSSKRRHILTKKTTQAKRHLRKPHLVDKTQEHQIRLMLPYLK